MNMPRVEARIHIRELAATIVKEVQTERQTDRVIVNRDGRQAWRLRVPERVKWTPLNMKKEKKKKKAT